MVESGLKFKLIEGRGISKETNASLEMKSLITGLHIAHFKKYSSDSIISIRPTTMNFFFL